MRDKNSLVQAWLMKADKDLLTAKRELSFEDPVVESVCFHSQQAVEKYIKAYLVYKDISFSKTHDIGKYYQRKCNLKKREKIKTFF
ncbi:MAG: HEPN domain-containing protein [Leptospiraceae bacterium]|nr:HEPN domain-containing protein [Leptospiraceae bacterium]MCP5500342.1 HEPN domain-containing protein [Leptospiraceae bacterium]